MRGKYAFNFKEFIPSKEAILLDIYRCVCFENSNILHVNDIYISGIEEYIKTLGISSYVTKCP